MSWLRLLVSWRPLLSYGVLCSCLSAAVLIQVQPKVSTGVVTAGGVEVVVDQLRVSTQVALQSLGVMADVHAGVVWAALLKLSGASSNTF